jgi:hypothetical protein
LKFVINKAKNYVKKIFNVNYDDIVKEIENWISIKYLVLKTIKIFNK